MMKLSKQLKSEKLNIPDLCNFSILLKIEPKVLESVLAIFSFSSAKK